MVKVATNRGDIKRRLGRTKKPRRSSVIITSNDSWYNKDAPAWAQQPVGSRTGVGSSSYRGLAHHINFLAWIAKFADLLITFYA